jgi:hypothetical protein
MLSAVAMVDCPRRALAFALAFGVLGEHAVSSATMIVRERSVFMEREFWKVLARPVHP